MISPMRLMIYNDIPHVHGYLNGIPHGDRHNQVVLRRRLQGLHCCESAERPVLPNVAVGSSWGGPEMGVYPNSWMV